MIIRIPRALLFPLAITAFIGVTMSYANIIFTTNTRWLFLALLSLYLVAKGRLLGGFQSIFGLALLTYCAWCILSSSWSIVPELSLYKSVALALVAVAFASGGYWWVFARGALNALNCLIPVTALALFAGSTGGVEITSGITMYQGLTGNPNMLGSLVCMALPLLIWNCYKYWRRPPGSWIWIGLFTIAAILLVRSHSRASFLTAGFIIMGFLASLRLKKNLFVLVLIIGPLFLAVAAGTAVVQQTYERYLLKGFGEEHGVLYTRAGVWQKSYENALVGGWFGIGFGGTVGETNFAGGLNAIMYGREKGNTQLGVVEETGLVGLGFYLIVLSSLFSNLIGAYRREKHPDKKILMGLILGSLVGFTAMSIFEAWWGAPGSAELAFFWSVAGVGLGLAEWSRYAQRRPVPRQLMHELPRYAGALLPQRRVKG